MRVKKDEKGFTVVEVLIATAILAIVVLTVCGFIMVGSKSYAAGNSDINVQQEAQLALNQMSDVLIDTTRSVNYVGYDSSGDPVPVLKDAEFTFTPADKSLIMFNGVVEETPAAVPGGTPSKTVDAGNGNKHYHFYWSKDNETLYYAELDVQSTDVDTKAIHFPAFDPADPIGAGWVELASHVTDFSVDLSQVEEKRVVQLALTFLDGRKEYVTSNNVTIRNKVAVNDAEPDPLNRKKTLSVTPRDSGVIIEPGETFHFSTPKVTGENVADRSVTWSLASWGSPSGGTSFTDIANGILKVAEDEPAGTINVVITTNAVDSDGNHASCTVPVNIKRATGVALSKTADTNADNGPLEISPGCTFTISATVDGNKLGQTCSVCSSPDIDIDKAVGNDANGTVYPWYIHSPKEAGTSPWDPRPYVEIIESEPDHATFRLKDNAPTYDPDTGIAYTVVIQAMSLLSVTDNTQGRHYDNRVAEGIELHFVKGSEEAEPYGGKLKYGEETLDESIREGLPTDYNQYVTAIRVVDNTGKEPDKVLLHFTIGGGNNLRVAPDLFDLDLNGSYTFYIQALFPIAEDRYVEGRGGYPDPNDVIRDEYFSHLSKSRPYGYEGTRYRHGKVFYAKLDKPKLTYKYKGVEYHGKNITYDPVNIYAVGAGSGIVGEIRPSGYENIVEDNSAWTYISNSLYEGAGSNQSQWNKIYYANEDSIADKDEIQNCQNIEYFGSNKLADGAVVLDPKGSMFMKRESGGNPSKACGEYHIVPGMLYQNKDPRHYEIIGWQGFDFPNLPRKVRYYEFDDSTIHVKVNGDFTMDINHEKFKGKVDFPLPKDMKNSSLFPNIESLEWQTTPGSLTVAAMPDGWSNAYNMTFSYVRYCYIKKNNAWEVEPVTEEFDAATKKIRVYTYGRYKCKADGTKWEFLNSVATEEKELVCNLEGLTINGNTRKMYFPLPSESSFPFRNGTTRIDCDSSHVVFDDDGNADIYMLMNNGVRIKYEHVGNVHRIIFVNKYWEPTEYSAFECTDGATKWTKIR